MDLKTFLKLYTAIDEKFIDEYYKFYEMCQDDMYGINILWVIDYLQIKKKEEFMKRFRDKYNNPNDYIVKKYKHLPIKGITNTEYFITLDAFENLCMSSKSEQANKVRDYFITLRKFIVYYKNNIHKMIDNELRNNKQCIYILLVDNKANFYKIGKSKKFRNRLYQYSTGKLRHPDIKFIMLVNDALQVENCIKLFMKNNQYKKEIYKVDITSLKKFVVACASLSNESNQLDLKNFNKSYPYDGYIIYDEFPLSKEISNEIEIITPKKNIKKKSSKKKSSKKK